MSKLDEAIKNLIELEGVRTIYNPASLTQINFPNHERRIYEKGIQIGAQQIALALLEWAKENQSDRSNGAIEDCPTPGWVYIDKLEEFFK